MKREDMSEDDLMREVEKTKDRAMNAQAERTRYLGEFKERVIVALTKEQVAEDEIYIEVNGKGGHAAMPNDIVDTILASSQILIALQQIVSRKSNPAIERN